MTQTKAELLQTRHQGDIRLGDADSTNYVGFKAPATVGSNLVWTLPATDGSANQFLQTNASGVLGWGTADVSSAMPLSGGTFTGDVIFTGDAANVTWDKSTDDLIFNDSARAIFGTNSDGLILLSNGTLIETKFGAEHAIKCTKDGSVELYHDNVKKFETSAAGIAITGAATVSTNLTVTGDLTVSGTTTTINTQTLDVEDKNVVIGKVSSPSDTTADGGGWTLKGATDKTFNWVNATDAWTSSEHIHLIDNKKLFVGGASGTTDGLELFHDSSDSYVKDNGTGRLVIETNGSDVSMKAGSDNMVVAAKDGAVTLYHDNSAKLATTTGGINVTGAINVNGSALSTAPQITATADGALTAGDPVIVKTDGEVTKVAPAYNVLSPYTTPDATGFAMGSNDVENCVVIFDSALSTSLSKVIFWILYRNQSNGDQIWLSSYNATDNTYVNGANSLGSGVPWKGVYDTTRSRMLLTFRDSSGNIKVSSISTNGVNHSNTNIDSTATMASTFSSNENHFYGLSYQGSGISVWAGPDSTTSGSAVVLTVASNGLITKSSNQSFNTDSTYHESVRVAGNGTQVVVIYKKANDSYHSYYRVGTISGSGSSASISWGTATKWVSSGTNDHDVAYDSVNDKYLFMFQISGSTGKVKVGTVSGTSISFGSETAFSSGNISNQGNIAYNVKTASFTICFEDSSNGTRIQTRDAKISGTSVTVNNNLDTSQYTTNKGFNVAHGYVSDTVFGSFLAYRYNSGRFRGQRLSTMELGTNVTTENFIGFAAAGASDNATATIDVSGATNSNQSSLTPGQKYFVQNNGSLGLTAATPEVFAGTAISATKIIVNDQAPPAATATPIWETISYETDISGVSDVISNGWNFARYSQIKVVGSQFICGFNNFDLDLRVYFTPHGGSESLSSGTYYQVSTKNQVNSGNFGGGITRSGSYLSVGNNNSAETWDFEWTFNVNNKTSGSFAGLNVLRGFTLFYKSAQLWEVQEVMSYAWQASGNLSGIKLTCSSTLTNARLHIIGLVAGS